MRLKAEYQSFDDFYLNMSTLSELLLSRFAITPVARSYGIEVNNDITSNETKKSSDVIVTPSQSHWMYAEDFEVY